MLKLISAEINQYCEENSQGDSELLQELISYTYETEDIPQMVSGIQVGNVLQGFIKSINASSDGAVLAEPINATKLLSLGNDL